VRIGEDEYSEGVLAVKNFENFKLFLFPIESIENGEKCRIMFDVQVGWHIISKREIR